MGQVKNSLYKDFLDGFLLNEVSREDLTRVLDGIQHEHRDQARAMVITAWATGGRPNEYLRLTPAQFSTSKEYLEIKMPGSKGSDARIISLPRYVKDGTPDPLTTELFDYMRSLLVPNQYLFWFFRSDSKRNGVTKRYKLKDGRIVEKHYDKIYDKVSNKLIYYFPKWFSAIFPDGVPPYYLRHNRSTRLLEISGRDAVMMNMGWKSEATMKRYVHKTKKTREQIAEGLMK